MGKASLDNAIRATKDLYDVHVEWKPFFLRPNMPPEGVACGAPRGDGTFAPSGPYWHYAIDRARSLGIDMSGDCNRFPNTTLSHALLSWAHKQRPAGQHHLAELIFQAYYSKNIFLDLDALVELATKAGYSAEKARAHLLSRKGEAAVKAEARSAGVSGVPYFIINGEGVFSGAQDPEAFKQAFAKAVKQRPLPPSAPHIYTGSQLAVMTPKQIKAVLFERGANPVTMRECVERDELVGLLMQLQGEQLQAMSNKGLRDLLLQTGLPPQEMAGVEKGDLIRRLLDTQSA